MCAKIDTGLSDRIDAREGADLVLAARVLHHAPKPAEAVRSLAWLLRARAERSSCSTTRTTNEALRTQQADLWLGFEEAELRSFIEGAGLQWREPERFLRSTKGEAPIGLCAGWSPSPRAPTRRRFENSHTYSTDQRFTAIRLSNTDTTERIIHVLHVEDAQRSPR